MKYTLNTDFSSLNGPKAANWIMDFQDMAEDAFADSSSHSRLLGNLLILESYVHTLRQGMAGRGRTVAEQVEEKTGMLFWSWNGQGRKRMEEMEEKHSKEREMQAAGLFKR